MDSKIIEILSWPAAFVILGIIVIFRFSPYIANLIGRIIKISKDGIELGRINGQRHKEQVSAKDLMKIFDNKLLLEVEGWIKSELDKIKHDSSEEKETLLIKLYASEKIARHFDQTYNLIFGSQIRALQQLNSFAGQLVSSNEIRFFYNEASLNNPLFYSSYSFDSWLAFMHSSVLIIRLGDSIGITVRGQEFLKYLIDQGLSHNKVG
jgi:hypothetical protein